MRSAHHYPASSSSSSGGFGESGFTSINMTSPKENENVSNNLRPAFKSHGAPRPPPAASSESPYRKTPSGYRSLPAASFISNLP